MPIKKIQAGRVITVDSLNFVGEHGTIFYDETLGDLRISDGETPGGRLINLDVVVNDPQSGQTLQYNGTRWVNVNADTVGLSTATISRLGGVKIGENINISADGTISVPKGAGINQVTDIPDVYNTAMDDGSTLVYNAAAGRWEVTISSPSLNIDPGEF